MNPGLTTHNSNYETELNPLLTTGIPYINILAQPMGYKPSLQNHTKRIHHQREGQWKSENKLKEVDFC